MATAPERWDALVDRLWALDDQYPYIGQIIEPTDDAETRQLADWDESRHPRDERGRWTSLMGAISDAGGGFTYNVGSGKPPKSGYVVSIRKDLERVFHSPADFKMGDLLAYARENWKTLNQRGNHLGGWHDPASGRIVLDVSRVVKTEAEAAALAAEHNQDAYFDLQRFESVYTNPQRQLADETGYTNSYGTREAAADAARRRGQGADVGGARRDVQAPDRPGSAAGRGAGRPEALRRVDREPPAGGATSLADWDESAHPREPAGQPGGGRFTGLASGGPQDVELAKAAAADISSWPELKDSESHAASFKDAEDWVRNKSTEYAVVALKDRTIRFGTSGAPDYVVFPDHGDFTDAVFSHNHPRGTSLSVDDIHAAVAKNFAEMRVVTRDGTYSLSRKGARWPVGFDNVVRSQDWAVRVKFLEAIGNGRMTKDEANQRHNDERMKRIAAAVKDITYEFEPHAH